MRSFSVIVLLLILWQILSQLFHVPTFLLPSPWLIAKTLWVNHALLLTEAWPTVVETITGLCVGTAIGFVVASLMSLSKTARLGLWPIIIISQAIPTIAIAPLLVLWLDYGMASKIATSAVALFFPIASSLFDGLRRTPEGLLEVSQSMQAKFWRQWWHIQLPSALPAFASGLRMACAWAPMAAVVGEWVGSDRGLGFLIIQANARLQTPLMFAALVFLVLFSLLLYFAVDALLNIFIPWSSS